MKRSVRLIFLCLVVITTAAIFMNLSDKSKVDSQRTQKYEQLESAQKLNLRLLELLLKNKLTKAELVNVLSAQKETYFENLEENTVGVKSTIFVFNKENVLISISNASAPSTK